MSRATAIILAVVCLATVASAQAIEQQRGIDPSVDYTKLDRFGPWDDRNYELTEADLAVLSPTESDLRDPIPAFFRVEMRKAWPELQKTGPAQYPRSALNIFRQMYGGYLIDGKMYNQVHRVGDRFQVLLEDGVESDGEMNTRFLTGEVRVTSPIGAAESAIKINPVDSSKVIAGSNGPNGGQKMHWSSDGGDSWTQTTLPLGSTCCDPTVDWKSDGSLAYSATLGNCGFGGCGVWFYRSNDNGATWTGLESTTPGDPRRELTNSGSDKEFIHVDNSPTSPFQDNIYVTWHNANVMRFAVSTDDGNSFSQQTFSSLTEDRGIGSDITTDAAGNVYYFWPAFNSRTIRLRKSTNGGSTFGSTIIVDNTEASFTFPVPSIDTRDVFVYASVDSDRSGGAFDGSIYVAWTDSTAPTSGTPSANHSRIQVAFSRDGGNNWSTTTPHETADANSVDRWHQWLSVGPDGTVHVVYYDTRNDPSRTGVDLYYSFSVDGAQTWDPPRRVTSELSPNIGDGFEFGDYNGLDIVLNDLIAIFTDNRNESGGSTDSVDVYAAGIAAGGATCGDDVAEPGEACDGTDLDGRSCADFGCSGGTLACDADCQGFDTTACNDCPTCNDNGVCDPFEDCDNCPGDCVSGTSSGAVCGNGICETADGENCLSCSSDCNGKQNGKRSARFCCGSAGENPVSCGDSRCTSSGFQCTSSPASGDSFCCGDGICDTGENLANCALDCGCAVNGDCDDAIACTVDSCDGGACSNAPDDGQCPDDGLFCNGSEFCDGGSGCESSGDPCDANFTCNEATDSCDQGTCAPRNALCSFDGECCSNNCKNNGRCR